MGIIYKAVCLENQKIYVGQTTCSLEVRKRNHFTCKGCKHFYAALKKYGKASFVWEILEESEDKEKLDEAEIRWIAFYDSTNPEKGYNLSTGGQGASHKQSLETKLKHSEAMKAFYATLTEEEKQARYSFQKGKTMPEKIRKKISKARLGKPFTEEHKQHLAKAWETRADVTQETRQKLSRANTGKVRTAEAKENYKKAAKLREQQKKEIKNGVNFTTSGIK